MTEADLPGLLRQVLLGTFGLAAVFGAVAQRSHFCTMGAVSDWVVMGDTGRMRMWVVAMATAILGFNAMVALGWVKAGDSIYAAPRLLWLSHVLGGVLFGFGMVLASGCGSKTLVRIGGGNLKSLVVFVVLAIAAYATMRGAVAVGRVASVDRVAVDLPAGQDLPSLLAHASGMALPGAAALAGGLVALLMFGWVLLRAEGRRLDTWWPGLAIGATIVGVWWVSGRLGFVPEHPQTLEATFLATNSQRMESLTFVAPVAYTVDWLILFSDKSKVLTIAIVSVFGVVAGSAAMALATRSFRWEGFASTEDTALHLVGAVLMGIGGVTALGCTVGQGLTGLSTLALGSMLTLVAIIAGAVAALKWQMWRLERAA